jgi:hypothetical protein
VVDYAAHTSAFSLVTKASTGFVLATKDPSSRTHWFRNEAEINLDLAKRCVLGQPRESLFRQFDGATMMQSQFTSRVMEEAWCAANSNRPTTVPDAYCDLGHGFSPDLVVISSLALSVRPSAVANGGRGARLPPSPLLARLGSGPGGPCPHSVGAPPHGGRVHESLAGDTIEDSMATFWSVVYEKYLLGYGFRLTDHVRCPTAVAYVW